MATPFYAQQYATKTLSSGIDNSQTTGIVIGDTTDLDTAKPGIACLTWSDPINETLAEWISYTSINGSNEFQGVVRAVEKGSAKSHLASATVSFPLSESHINRLADKLTGRDATAIEDANGNEILKTASVASAVNEITVTNAITGTTPFFQASGGDTNISAIALGKGTGFFYAINDGWIPAVTTAAGALETWTYASVSSFTVAGDQTAKYVKGTKIKYVQTTQKYAVVASSSYSAPNTTVNIYVNTDYTVVNAAISSPFISYADNPLGWPDWFNFTKTITWNSTQPSGTTTTTMKYAIKGQTCFFEVKQNNTVAGATNTQVTFAGPVAANESSGEYNVACAGLVSTGEVTTAPTADTRAVIYTTTPDIFLFFTSLSAKSFIVSGSYRI